MNNEPTEREIVLIALGGSGTRTAVLLREKIAQIESENLGNIRVNCRVLSIDFGNAPEFRNFVGNEEYLPLLRSGENLFDNWANLFRDIENSGTSIQPWAKVGPPSEIEIFLARDAQQSGIRRVDYLLQIHQSIERITQSIQSILEKVLIGKDEGWMGPNIIILGSLAGRTSSELYVPILKILEELSPKFEFAQVLSFLYTPTAIEKLFQRHSTLENSINSFKAINRIVNYFWSDSARVVRPAQFLINKADHLLVRNQDNDVKDTKNKTMENILRLVYLDPNTTTWNSYYVNWIIGSSRNLDLTRTKNPNDLNHPQIFALLDSEESSLTESGINEDFLKKVHPHHSSDWAWIENSDQAVLCGTEALSPWVFNCLTKPIESQLERAMGYMGIDILEILYSHDLYDSVPVSSEKLQQIIFSINVAALLKKIKVVEDEHYCEFQFIALGDKNHLSLKIPSFFGRFFPNRIEAIIAYIPFALIESSRNGQLSMLDFYQIDGAALLSNFLNTFQSTESSQSELDNLIEDVKTRVEKIESAAYSSNKIRDMLVGDLKALKTSIADLKFRPFN